MSKTVPSSGSNGVALRLAPSLASFTALPLRVVIVDDEPLARSRLKQLVQACDRPRCAVVAECANADELHAALKHGHADCVLLDIQMPGMNGLDLAAQLQQSAAFKPAIVFVTAHDQHALKAFELEASDYLTKPVRQQRLQAALERVLRQRQTAPGTTGGESQGTLLASERGRVVHIPIADVVVLRAELKYVNVRSAERTWVLDESLTELEHRLGESADFIRIHRNALVAGNRITALDKRAVMAAGDDDGGDATWAVHVAGLNEWLPVSRRQLPAVRDAVSRAASASDAGCVDACTLELT